MATFETRYLGNLRTEITHLQSGNTLTTDAPTDNHGKGEFFSPTDMLASALGSCMLTIMGIAAKTHGFSIDGAFMETTKVMGSNPRRVAELVIKITFPHNKYSEKELKILNTSAKECPVANSLHPDVKQTVSFFFKEV
ncbi:MAG: OsmC family protein [Prevotellaceae bacterium]|jgi:uncharacterized OsmC-like protein|nr:OsmC family protein [Prevotellaceae bacterium]